MKVFLAQGAPVLTLVALGGVLAAGCTVAMYPGPQRPATETARVEAIPPSSVRNIDGMDLPIGSLFTVLPGLHVVTVGAPYASSMAACFKAEAGHRYVASLDELGRGFEVSMMDVGAMSQVRSVEVAPGSATCAAVASAWNHRPRPIARAGDTAAAPVPAKGGAIATEDDQPESDSETPPQVGSSGEAVLGAPVAMAVDPEMPRARRSRNNPSLGGGPNSTADENEDPIWARHPGNGLALELGGFFGGTALANTYDQNGNTVATLRGGGGVVLGVGGMWTPLWAGDAAGFGLSAVLSLKYQTISAGNGSVSLLRFPVSLAAHTFLHVGGRWWFLLRGGVQKELGVSLSADGSSGSGEASLTGSVGGLGEVGVYYLTHVGKQRTALLVAFRYTSGTDSAGNDAFDSSSGGLVMGLHHNF